MEDAEQLYRRAVSLSPSTPAPYIHYGLFLLDADRYGEAVTAFGAAVRLQPAVYDYVFNLAVAARLAGQLELAESSYRRAVGLRPAEAEPHLNLGALLHLRGRLVEAEDEYIKAWTIKPGEQTTRLNLQRLHNIMKKNNITTQDVEV